MTTERSKTIAALRLLAALAALGCVGGSICSPSPTPPPPDSCSTPTTGSVNLVALATPRMDPSAFGTATALDDQPPRSLDEGDPLWRVRGGQGAEMVAVRLVLLGSDVPSCLAQDTTVTVDGKLAARNRDNVSTYPYEGGARVTKSIWLPGAFGATATVTSDVAGKMPTVNVRTGELDSCESLSACPCQHALDFVSTAGLSDGGAARWNALSACRESCDAGQDCVADGGQCAEALRACEADPY